MLIYYHFATKDFYLQVMENYVGLRAKLALFLTFRVLRNLIKMKTTRHRALKDRISPPFVGLRPPLDNHFPFLINTFFHSVKKFFLRDANETTF